MLLAFSSPEAVDKAVDLYLLPWLDLFMIDCHVTTRKSKKGNKVAMLASHVSDTLIERHKHSGDNSDGDDITDGRRFSTASRPTMYLDKFPR